jgi:hypothetical protein
MFAPGTVHFRPRSSGPVRWTKSIAVARWRRYVFARGVVDLEAAYLPVRLRPRIRDRRHGLVARVADDLEHFA